MENMHTNVRVKRVSPFTPKISSVILLTFCHTNFYDVSLENLVLNQQIIP